MFIHKNNRNLKISKVEHVGLKDMFSIKNGIILKYIKMVPIIWEVNYGAKYL